MKIGLLITCLNVVLGTIQIDTSKHCDCSELNENDCNFSNLSNKYCFWKNGQCQTYSYPCGKFTQNECTALSTQFLCKWNGDSCTDHLYQCDDFTTKEQCPCFWNINSQTCGSFSSCSSLSIDKCPSYFGCDNSSGVCDDAIYITCSDQTTQQCKGSQSSTQNCSLKDDNTCQAISSSATCEDLNGFRQACVELGKCKYINGECQRLTCNDLPITDCVSVEISTNIQQLCTIQGIQCISLDNASSLIQSQCYEKTYNTFKWTQNGCVQCNTQVSNTFSQEITVFIIGLILLLII